MDADGAAPPGLEDLAESTAARHAQGQDELAGHAELYRRDARWIAEHQDELTSAVTLVRSPGLSAGAEYAYASTVPAGASLHDVVSTRVLVASTHREDLVRAWAVVRDAFGDHDVPSTLLGVTVLGYEDQLVEPEATAAVLR